MSTILIIDDEPAICMLLAETVSGEGWTPQFAHTISEGLKKATTIKDEIENLD